jgi:hypothetical protein
MVMWLAASTTKRARRTEETGTSTDREGIPPTWAVTWVELVPDDMLVIAVDLCEQAMYRM